MPGLAPQQVIEVGVAVVTAQRDFGNRAVRKRARLKYTIDDRGLGFIVGEIERRAARQPRRQRPRLLGDMAAHAPRRCGDPVRLHQQPGLEVAQRPGLADQPFGHHRQHAR